MAQPRPKIQRYKNGERFRWEAVDRTTGTVYREDENRLGTWYQLKPGNLSHVRIYELVAGGEMCIDLEVPEGAEAVFRRRRGIPLGENQPRVNWTIIGYQWADGTGQYTFFRDDKDMYFQSEDFRAV